MKEAIYVWLFFGLPAWWLAQALLSLRDYYRQRHKLRQMPPPTEEEKAAVARVLAAHPHKEKKSFRWYATHPMEAAKQSWYLIPLLLLFWPMAVLLHKLPPLEIRLSKEMVSRVNSGEE